MDKMIPVPAPTATFHLFFFYLFFFIAKGIAIFVSAFLPKLPNQEPKDPPD